MVVPGTNKHPRRLGGNGECGRAGGGGETRYQVTTIVLLRVQTPVLLLAVLDRMIGCWEMNIDAMSR